MVSLLKIIKQKYLAVLNPYRIVVVLLFYVSVSAFAQESTTAINTFPYTEDFEGSNGGWTAGDLDSL